MLYTVEILKETLLPHTKVVVGLGRDYHYSNPIAQTHMGPAYHRKLLLNKILK